MFMFCVILYFFINGVILYFLVLVIDDSDVLVPFSVPVLFFQSCVWLVLYSCAPVFSSFITFCVFCLSLHVSFVKSSL